MLIELGFLTCSICILLFYGNGEQYNEYGKHRFLLFCACRRVHLWSGHNIHHNNFNNWQFLMTLTIEAEYIMTSVERIVDYSNLSSEADFHGLKDSVNSFDGSISFRNVWLRYAEKEPYVLKDLTFSIQEKEKVCILSLQ